MPVHRSQTAERARSLLAGQHAGRGELDSLVRSLKAEQEFHLARRLLQLRLREPEVESSAQLRLKFGRELAVCTYKDPELSVERRFDEALAILKKADDLQGTQSAETLGIAGAIYKRRWEALSRRSDLEQSFTYYQRGYVQGPAHGDHWYPGINAAFVLDLLAAQEMPATLEGKVAETIRWRVEYAAQIRREILQFLDTDTSQPMNWWRLATKAEALFGLGRFGESERVITSAKDLPDPVPDWEKESTARQLAWLAQLRHKLPLEGQEDSEIAKRVLQHLAGGNVSAAASMLRGRIGLALSGGGFRASLFHIGVLARLAELDLLRGVECISCVSGGSIIGAHYYLHVRHLLQTKPDSEIVAADYVSIVEKVTQEFLIGVQRNIRTRVPANILTNLRLMLCPDYSATKRVGELYEKELFRRVADGEGNKERWLDELAIIPNGASPTFKPRIDNWKRSAKVPSLILNATTLNTGHNWQYTVRSMGEPPAGITERIDANARLRRLDHDDAPREHRRTRLGYAVAASSCVPGLFEPLALADLYRDWELGLVDGGVYDNQGTSALLEQDCSAMIVSDASGQMDDIKASPSGPASVLFRANSILQARIREAQQRELATRRAAGLLSGLVFLHLKNDLQSELVDWIGCQDPSERQRLSPLTSYKVQRDVQNRLAAIRTDLDSFTDTEAYALMTSGYLMTTTAFESEAGMGFHVAHAGRRDWRFLCIEPSMTEVSPDKSFLRRLEVAEQMAFKAWRLSRPLRLATGAAALLVLGLLALMLWEFGQDVEWTMRPASRTTLGELAVGAAVFLVVALSFASWVQLRRTVVRFVIGVGMATIGFLGARLHLHVFDRIFLRDGRQKPKTRRVVESEVAPPLRAGAGRVSPDLVMADLAGARRIATYRGINLFKLVDGRIFIDASHAVATLDEARAALDQEHASGKAA